MRITKLGTYTVEQHNSPNRGGKMSDHRGLVQHIAEGTYKGTISWQMNPDQRYSDGTKVNTCSTWIVGKEAGEIAQMVDSDEIAWCQRSGSNTWLSVEYAGKHTEALTAWQIDATALLLQWCHEKYNIPIQIANNPAGRGLGHHSMDRENQGEEWGHEDCPGSRIIAQKPIVISRALDLGGTMTSPWDDNTKRFNGVDQSFGTMMCLTAARADWLANKSGIGAAVAEILKKVSEDDTTGVSLTPEQITALAAEVAEGIHIPSPQENAAAVIAEIAS